MKKAPENTFPEPMRSKLREYRPTEDFSSPKWALVGVKNDLSWLTVTLGSCESGEHAADIGIERRDGCFAAVITPVGQDDPIGILYIMDDGRTFFRDEPNTCDRLIMRHLSSDDPDPKPERSETPLDEQVIGVLDGAPDLDQLGVAGRKAFISHYREWYEQRRAVLLKLVEQKNNKV